VKIASLFCLSATLFLQAAFSQVPAAPLAPAPVNASQDKPRVYITDSNSWEVRSAGGGNSNGFGGSSAGGARPQTAEVIKTFGQRCPEIIVNSHVNATDYVVELDHEGGKGLLMHKDKIAVFVQTSGDSIFSESTLSVGGSVKDACGAILGHWAAHEAELKSASAAGRAPKEEPVVGSGVPASAVSVQKPSLTVASTPSGADIEINGSFVGNTPSVIDVEPGDQNIVISKKGYQPWSRKLKITGGNINISAELDATAVKAN
jgi:PEGA domain